MFFVDVFLKDFDDFADFGDVVVAFCPKSIQARRQYWNRRRGEPLLTTLGGTTGDNGGQHRAIGKVAEPPHQPLPIT